MVPAFLFGAEQGVFDPLEQALFESGKRELASHQPDLVTRTHGLAEQAAATVPAEEHNQHNEKKNDFKWTKG